MVLVTISYNSRRFRVKLSPSGILNDVVPQSLKHYGLLREGVSRKWTLFHNDKEVELNVPWRLLNLSENVNLELKPSSDCGDDEKVIKLRIQLSGYDSKVKSVDVNSNVQQIISELWPVLDSGAELQVFNTTIPIIDLNDHTWKSLGIVKPMSVRIILPGQAAEIKVKNPNVSANEISQVKPENKQSEKTRLHQVFVYVPSNKTLASWQNIDQGREIDSYDLTVDHAKIYRRMVQKQAGGLGGPMVPKKIKEQEKALKAINRRKMVQECLVRVRFPDRTHIEVAFKNDDIIATVYQVISDSLRDNQSNFTLYHSSPHVALPSNDQKLVQDLLFGPRTLLLFESSGKGPFLKDGILNGARSLLDSYDIQQNRSPILEANIEPEKKQKEQPNNSNNARKYPKWLKLSKK